jgi:hypothetical protein
MVTQNKVGATNMKSFRDYLQEAEDKKKKTQTKTKDDDWSGLDDLFTPKADQPLTRAEPEAPAPDQDNNDGEDRRKKSSQQDTLRATQNIHPTDNMRNMLGRMRDIEADDEDDGYPEPEQNNLPDVRVNTQNLPAVAGRAIAAAGVQDPDFHKVANLPGNMARAIRSLGKQLFRSFTRTSTDDIWMIGNLGGQGPNSRQEVNAVAGWVRDNGQRVTDGNIDFDTTIPGYQADIQQWSASGIRWLLVRDEFGDYIYSWPEQDSVNAAAALDAPEENEPRRLGR